MKETELYEPVKRLLVEQGYEVKAEVKDIDILGYKDDVYLAVELKTSFSMKLIYQAIDRQKTMDIVYIAIPKTALPKSRTQYRQMIYLLKRLEIGCIIVNEQHAEVILETTVYDIEKSRARYKKRKQIILKEYHLRKNTLNVGGSKGKRLTRYKEMVVDIGLYLLAHQQASVKEIKEHTNILKAASILQKNYDQYFERVSRGIYQLTEKGKKEITELNQKFKGEQHGNN